MRILHVALEWDYGRPEQGPSFEHQTFYEALRGMGHELQCFDFHRMALQLGRERMNQRLLHTVLAYEPELLFCVLFGDELDPDVMRFISEETSTVTINWFCDDHWRFETFSSRWAPNFNWVVTTAPVDAAPYEERGLNNVIRSQWACNSYLYRRSVPELPALYDVSFVGMAYGGRAQALEALRRAGVGVRAWGSGWEDGRLPVADMVRVFNQSRVNLNFADAWVPAAEGARPRKSVLERTIRAVPGSARAVKLARRFRHRLPGGRTSREVTLGAGPIPPVRQLKARTFEVTGSGGFLLTQEAPELRRYFEPEEEVGVFEDPADLVEAVRYYLADEDRRRRIAQAGYDRVMREHTYERRFRDIFGRIGLSNDGSS